MRRLITCLLVTALSGVIATPADAQSPTSTERPAAKVRSDLLSGVDVTVREIEPGIYRAHSSDVEQAAFTVAHPDTTFIGGLDGSVRYAIRHGLYRLGVTDVLRWERYWAPFDYTGDYTGDIAVAPDGGVWLALSKGVLSHDGRAWTVHLRVPKEDRGEGPSDEGVAYLGLEVTPDGSVWVARHDGRNREVEVLRQTGGRWTTVERLKAGGAHLSSYADDLWLLTSDPQGLYRYADGRFQRLDLPERFAPVVIDDTVYDGIQRVRPGPDGSAWLQACIEGPAYSCDRAIAHFDGSEWQLWLGVDDQQPGLDDWSGPRAVTSDGAAWFAGECEGVTRFDGTGSHRLLDGYCVQRMAVTPRGDVWLIAGRRANEQSKTNRAYVITPEAVASTE